MKNIYRIENSIIFKKEFWEIGTGNLISPVETPNYTIVQIADSYYGSRFCVPNHRQICDLEITYPLTNGLVCSNNGTETKLNKHDVYLSYKDDIHELKSTKSCRFKTLAINIKQGECFKILKEIKALFSHNRSHSLQQASTLISSVISEFSETDYPFKENYLDGLITSLLVTIVRADFKITASDILSVQELASTIMTHIDLNFLKIHSIEELCSDFGYTYSYLSKTFNKYYETTPSQYLLSKKMDYAVMLLKKDEPIKNISEKLGYSTPYNFSRAFKKYYGMAPSKFTYTENQQ